MNIPLINSNSKQDINTSLIAIRNAINELSRMKESASVEDLQRQINIINQQIANFNSEFSAINTHLNTIDTNILNLQPVDTVASGNLHSVTSNAVFNSMFNASMLTFWQDDTRKDPLAVADMLGTDWYTPYNTDRFVTFRLGHDNSVNSPYGNGNTDFFYHMYKLADGYWITLTAYDVRSRAIFTNSKVNGAWQGWQEIQKIEYALADAPIVDVPFSLSEGSFSNIRIRNGVYHLVGRYFSSTPIAITEGMIIGHLRQDYYINPTWDFCVNVHSFSTNEDYILWIYHNGDIRIFGIGNRTIALDFYIDTTYVK